MFVAYQKALHAHWAGFIGRIDDLWLQAELSEEYGVDRHDGLWSPAAQGNILFLDKWNMAINDAWLLSGIHRHANFRLLSPLAPQNLWNEQAQCHVVIAREILGLLHFGYRAVWQAQGMVFTCVDTDRANKADLIRYAELMDIEKEKGRPSITPLITEPVRGLLRQIRMFKKEP
ncbi:hypothetical protein CEJ32_20065 [Enterobacter sp. 9-2]|nr:hypothetical protein CEJ32_20065 [Enterobacter sp. 9-2]